ncbi:MAG: phosphohydrolase [Chlorobiaceae bacterium]|nr:phosphohydrolase [Chlorobiaceae bacterium]
MSAQFTDRFTEAFKYAAQEHRCQLRKDTNIPYISHLMSVSALVWENGGDEDQAIAGLLHDVIEDADPPSAVPRIRKDILEKFGPRVLALVEGCTDGEQDANGQKAPWRERKATYLANLRHEPKELLLVSCCDKLHNARAILTDLITHGESFFNRFTGKKDGTLWYYRELCNIYQEKLPDVVAVRELASVVDAIEKLCSKNTNE